jgi:hypothetical protein
MNSILATFLHKFVIVFMDDILVYNKSVAELALHLKEVFTVLRDHQYYVKLSMWAFAQQELEYLGHIISNDGVATNPKKTQAMLNFPIPANVSELRGFLGLTG